MNYPMLREHVIKARHSLGFALDDISAAMKVADPSTQVTLRNQLQSITTSKEVINNIADDLKKLAKNETINAEGN